jgi:hypothetical protein
MSADVLSSQKPTAPTPFYGLRIVPHDKEVGWSPLRSRPVILDRGKQYSRGTRETDLPVASLKETAAVDQRRLTASPSRHYRCGQSAPSLVDPALAIAALHLSAAPHAQSSSPRRC